MNVLVIGNGFDLAHHLPTQYRDFLNFVKSFRDPNDSAYSQFIGEIKENHEDLYQEVSSLINKNVLLNYFLSIYEERCKEGKNGWIDFESEISFIVQQFDKAKSDIENKFSKTGEAATLDKVLYKSLKPIIEVHREVPVNVVVTEFHFEPRFFDYQAERVLESLNKLIRLLEIYLHEYVEKLDCKYRINDLDGRGIDRVLSFNYTDTYRKYYDPEGKAQYCFIHGKAKESSVETCDLVLGIDEYLPTDRIDSDNQFVWFKKFYQRIYKGTGSEYLDWINQFEDFNRKYQKAKPSEMRLTIFGHSLDVTDKDILSRLIMMENTKTDIFYHNRETMAKQIGNLIKVIGEENLIRKTGGEDRSIRFIHSKPAKVINPMDMIMDGEDQ